MFRVRAYLAEKLTRVLAEALLRDDRSTVAGSSGPPGWKSAFVIGMADSNSVPVEEDGVAGRTRQLIGGFITSRRPRREPKRLGRQSTHDRTRKSV